MHHFWEKIERLNPDQADLRIGPELYAAWRESIKLKENGKPRAGQDGIVITVRSFYYDLHTWAAEEPERWGSWVAPCPVPPGELHGLGTRRRRINERSADRTRQRQPLLPILVAHVEQRYDHARTLLELADKAADGELFTHDGTTYRRVITEADHKLLRHGDPVPTRVRNEDSGQLIHIGTDEEAAFWDWASVETLRHSGVRIEEMCELTHLSIRQYQRPNGEVIALLVVAPSKTDRERVIPMSAELFHGIASVIRRHTRHGRSIPLVSRYDNHDKVWSAPMPFLFQRQNGSAPAAFSMAAIQQMIIRRGQALAETHPAFRDLGSPRTTFAGSSSPSSLTAGCPSTSGRLCSAISTSRPHAATSPSSTKTWSVTTRTTSTSGARLDPLANTGTRRSRSGTSSRSTSTTGRSNSVPADAPTERPASTNTPASAAPCCTSIPRCCPASRNWKPTYSTAERALKPRAGSARSKALTSPSPSSAPSAPKHNDAPSGRPLTLVSPLHAYPGDDHKSQYRKLARPSRR